jgi:hypothetical protein
MQISPEEAAKALQEIEASRAAMRRAILTHRGYLYLWIWGCAWVAMSLLNWAYDYRAGPADWLIVGGGVLASLGIGLFQGTRIRSRIDRRFAAVCTTLLVFGYLVWPVFFGVPGHGSLAALWGGFHSYKAAYGYFTVVWMQLYIIGGIWFDNFLIWVGLVVTALVIATFVFIPALFWALTLLCGVILLGSGFYVRQLWR